jgi:hypothetical protein
MNENRTAETPTTAAMKATLAELRADAMNAADIEDRDGCIHSGTVRGRFHELRRNELRAIAAEYEAAAAAIRRAEQMTADLPSF